MSVAPSTTDTSETSLPSAAALKVKAAWHEPIIYQPFLGAEQRSRIHAAAVPLDISFNTSSDTREYELFKVLHAHHRTVGLKDEAFWGLVSRKFEEKAPSSFNAFLEEAKKASQNGFDCYVYNPMIGNAAIFVSLWEQGRVNHPGMDKIFDQLVRSGINVGAVQGTKSFFCCNYVCGNERFWSSYFAFCEKVLDMLHSEVTRNTEVGKVYAGDAGYWRNANIGMRPFVIERLLGTFLHMSDNSGLKIAAYSPTLGDFERKFGQQLGGTLHYLYYKKNEAIENNDHAAYAVWQNARLPFAKDALVVAVCDDPPDWWFQHG